MADKTEISWTDSTWNPTLGCDKLSPGCRSCYAIRQAHMRAANPNAKVATAFAGLTQIQGGKPNWTGKINLLPDRLEQPLHWRKPRRVFVNSLSDLFHEDIPFEFIDRVFAVMALAPRHVYQILTKRPERMLEYFQQGGHEERLRPLMLEMAWQKCGPLLVSRKEWWLRENAAGILVGHVWPLPNVWLGVSAENQEWADKRIPLLLQCPAAVRFVSAEPLLGPITLQGETREPCSQCSGAGLMFGPDWNRDNAHPCPKCKGSGTQPGRWWEATDLDWVIAGGESGPGARPMHPDWARGLRDQCQAAGVAYHFKQQGSWMPFYDRDRDDPDWRNIPAQAPNVTYISLTGGSGFHGERVVYFRNVGKKAAGRTLDGVIHDAFPLAPAGREEG